MSIDPCMFGRDADEHGGQAPCQFGSSLPILRISQQDSGFSKTVGFVVEIVFVEPVVFAIDGLFAAELPGCSHLLVRCEKNKS